MKRLIGIGLLATVLGVFLYLRNAQAVLLDLAFDYDYSTDPPCTATLTDDCIEGFEFSGESGLLQTIPNPQACIDPAITNCIDSAGRAVGILINTVTGPPYGLQTFSVLAVARDGAGARVVSDSDTEVGLVPPGKPFNLRFPR